MSCLCTRIPQVCCLSKNWTQVPSICLLTCWLQMKHNFTRQIAPNWLWTQVWLWDNRGANANYVRKELPCIQCYLWCAICNLVILLVDCFPFLLLSKSTLCMLYGHKHTEKMRAMVNDLRCRQSKSTCDNICWNTGKTMIFFPPQERYYPNYCAEQLAWNLFL